MALWEVFMSAIHVLVIEDCLDDAKEMMNALIEGGFEPECEIVNTLEDFVEALSGSFDVILCDHNTKEIDIRTVLAKLEQRSLDLPLFIVASAVSEEKAVSAMRMGAQDFISKTNLARLVPALERELIEAENKRARLQAERELKEAQEQLRQSQKLEAIGRLASGVAHDFNNLLGTILGRCDLLREGLSSGSELIDEVDEIEAAAESATLLTKQLLAFARKQNLRLEPTDINSVLQNTRSLLGRTLGADVSIECELSENLPAVRIDRTQLEQVVLNLSINARDAMPNGGELKIWTHLLAVEEVLALPFELEAVPHVVLTVADTGTGIPEKVLENIFEPFFTTKDSGKGTGLGLATVYGVVKQCNGEIAVHSVEDEGTTFDIYLPALIDGASKKEVPVVEVQLPETSNNLTGDETILVVEDDDSYRHLVSHILRRQGYDVIGAMSGEVALKIGCAPVQEIDLLIADIVLPGMDGVRLAEKLKMYQPQMQKLFMSGHSSAIFQSKCGVDEETVFLQKPFRPLALCSSVRALLDRKKSADKSQCLRPRLLIIDDEVSLLAAWRVFFEHAGFDVACASDGEQAVDYFKSRSADVVVTDILMPGCDGYETMEKLRKLDKSVPIIAISGGNPNVQPGGLLVEAVGRGASTVLEKPFTCRVMLEAVKQVLTPRTT